MYNLLMYIDFKSLKSTENKKMAVDRFRRSIPMMTLGLLVLALSGVWTARVERCLAAGGRGLQGLADELALVLLFKRGLGGLFSVRSTIRPAQLDHFGMSFEIVDCHTDLKLFREF